MNEFLEYEKYLKMVINTTNQGGLWRLPDSTPPMLYTIEDGKIVCPTQRHYDLLDLRVTDSFAQENFIVEVEEHSVEFFR